jgi:ankyrin repeat protein
LAFILAQFSTSTEYHFSSVLHLLFPVTPYLSECCVSLLLSQGADTALMDSDGFTAAAHAVAFNHLSVLKILPISTLFTANLNPKSQISPSKENADNIGEYVEQANSSENDGNRSDIVVTHLRSACHIACQWGSADSLQLLLHYNCNIAESDALGTMGGDSGTGAVGPYEELPEVMDIQDVSGTPGIQGIPEATVRVDSAGTKKKKMFDVNATLSDGTAPLHLAARYGHLSCIKLLVAADADFRALDLYGNSPLLLAQKWGRGDCEEYLSGLCPLESQ